LSGGAPPLAAVLGWPIGHSRSPRLHGHWLRRYGIAGHYVPIALPPDELEAGLEALRILGFRGANVTIPHKVAVLALATSATERAIRIGAANTITFGPDRGFHADNTDGFGFVASLRQAAPVWSAKLGPALVLGAGGAARGVVSALLDEGGAEIRVANRTFEHAETLRAHLGDRVTPVKWAHATHAAEGVATVVNTTSLGMMGQPPLPFQLDAAPPDALVADLVYQPLETPLLAAARARGLAAVDGLGMLLHQAVPGFEAWFGRRPEVDDDLRAAVLVE
jgi:shikimate dehydrogenase